ncbi:MAG TPA: helix-turn-helix domain-containing protein [Streptosporangiaceae bacterium]
MNVTHTTAQQAGPRQAGCPIAPVVDIVFSRWTTPILWQLSTHGRQRFSGLRDLVDGITAKVLTQRLRQLERDGLVSRTMHAEIPPRVEYEITELGRSLAPVFAALVTWSEHHLADVTQARNGYDSGDKPLP